MENEKRDFNWKLDDTRARVLAAMLPEVTFDGWSDEAFVAALQNSGVDLAHAKLAFPNGAIDVASFMHRQGDARMVAELTERVALIPSMRAKIEAAVLLRLEIASEEKEAVRRAAALMALPTNMSTGSCLIWETADAIWRALGDRDSGFSHYSKRASLSAVYSASFLAFLTDDDPDLSTTKGFLTRRIDEVMRFGKLTSVLKKPFRSAS